ncbi:hypothetical protein RJ639_004119 [Escallonia herrerae]|uniref:C2H2-type domain-containing protein n=1 Tax=Escallonia herrerae TaxID=1293975 RepID=A0AA89AYF2_9ASTE|nr:hypothetical protein RJ639_004119 [Escallonia herrerae]
MEKTERETHDFMNVESFSQLPFIRPAPVKEKGIRLFGKEFGGDNSVTTDGDSESMETNTAREETNNKDGNNDNGESSRKFECHYCCRNFPTSQALGGHQNAHKRERQHAKRAHLQSAMVHGGFTEAHVYGIMNYHRLNSAPSPNIPYNTYYPQTWNGGNRFYGGAAKYNSQAQPINGSPLALWRIPAAQSSSSFNRDRSSASSAHPLPLFANGGNTGGSQSRYGYESNPAMQDHVLDTDGTHKSPPSYYLLNAIPIIERQLQGFHGFIMGGPTPSESKSMSSPDDT